MATSKSGGSTSNNRESHSKRLGAKLADGQFALAGGIIYRQRGTKVHPGNNVGRGGDDTLFTLIDGYVKYESRRNRTYASVYAERVEASTVTKKEAKAARVAKATTAKVRTPKAVKEVKTTPAA